MLVAAIRDIKLLAEVCSLKGKKIYSYMNSIKIKFSLAIKD